MYSNLNDVSLQNPYVEILIPTRISLVAQIVKKKKKKKNLPEIKETQVKYQGWEDPLEKGLAAHSSILAWRIPWTKEPGEFQSVGLQRVGHDWVTNMGSADLQNDLDSSLTLHMVAVWLLQIIWQFCAWEPHLKMELIRLIHFNVWQKPLQYCKVISLQLIKINEKKTKKSEWKKKEKKWN